jgi:hypothetical protein
MLTKQIQENFPFLTVITYGGNEYVGIIINQDQYVTSMYVYTKVVGIEQQQRFLNLGEVWWWESNRMIPISIFLRKEMEEFRSSIITMNTKDVCVILGPVINLNNLSLKRVKRKSVQLIRKTK